MNSFIQVFVAFKAFTSNLVLKIGCRVTFLFSLFVSILLGILIVYLYEVPVKDVQIYAHKTKGGNEKNYSILKMNMNYGVGLTDKYMKNYQSGVKLDIIVTDNWRKHSNRYIEFTQYTNNVLGINFPYDPTKIDKLFRDSAGKDFTDSIMSIYAIHLTESKLPRTIGSIKTEDSFETYKTLVNTRYGKQTINQSDKFSAIYKKTNNCVDSITGLDSFGALCYVAFVDSGQNKPIEIPSSPSLTEPSVLSLYDISQSYFRFTIDVPAEQNGARLEFDFGGATEFSGIYPKPDVITMSSIIYTDLNKLHYICDNGLWLHAKFSQMENFQILRMFIMTTLWGFFVALAFSSAFKSLKISSRKYRIKLNQKAKKQINHLE